jgi:hypothetical protein
MRTLLSGFTPLSVIEYSIKKKNTTGDGVLFGKITANLASLANNGKGILNRNRMIRVLI